MLALALILAGGCADFKMPNLGRELTPEEKAQQAEEQRREADIAAKIPKIVRAYTLTDVKGCARLGTIEAKVSGGTLFGAALSNASATPSNPADRTSSPYERDWDADARKQAAKMDGTHILQVIQGQRNFDIYRCP